MAICSDELCTNLLEILGVPSKNVRKAVITMEVDCLVVVDVEVYAGKLNDDGQLDVLMQSYELVLKEPVGKEREDTIFYTQLNGDSFHIPINPALGDEEDK